MMISREAYIMHKHGYLQLLAFRIVLYSMCFFYLWLHRLYHTGNPTGWGHVYVPLVL